MNARWLCISHTSSASAAAVMIPWKFRIVFGALASFPVNRMCFLSMSMDWPRLRQVSLAAGFVVVAVPQCHMRRNSNFMHFFSWVCWVRLSSRCWHWIFDYTFYVPSSRLVLGKLLNNRKMIMQFLEWIVRLHHPSDARWHRLGDCGDNPIQTGANRLGGREEFKVFISLDSRLSANRTAPHWNIIIC